MTTPLDEGVAVIDYLEVARARSKSRERSVAERAKFQELDVSGWELFRTGDFWLLLLYFGLLAGCGLMGECGNDRQGVQNEKLTWILLRSH